MKTTVTLAGVLAVLVLVSSCSVGISATPRIGVATGHGPPPHAPAHGWRAKHIYHYYPDVYVYFDVERKLYFYMKRGAWRVGTRLPADVDIGLRQFVVVSLDTAEPYVHFREHKSKYPPGQLKKQGGGHGRR